MLEEAGGLTELPALTLPALTRLGFSEVKASAVLAAVELARRLALAAVPDRQLMARPPEVATYLALRYFRADQEVVGALFLDAKNGLLGTCELFRGTLSRTSAEPRQVLREGLLRGAASVLLFHTHPTGANGRGIESLVGLPTGPSTWEAAMVRAVLDEGVIRPLETLPEHWADGQELVIDEAVERASPEDLEFWAREVEALAAEIPLEDFERVEAALAEADREAKAYVRRQMGLP